MARVRSKPDITVASIVAAHVMISSETEKGQFSKGSVNCPGCGLKNGLRYVRYPNGHIHATCKTHGCLHWLE